MLIYLTQGIAETNSAATTIISIAVMLFLGFATTRLTEPLRLPNVTAYILAGILIGPYCLNLIPTSVIAGTDFLSDIALAFIAFSTGEFFTISGALFVFFPHVLFLPGITIQQKNAPESGNGLDCLRNSGYDERVLTRKSSHQAMPRRQALRAVRLIIIFNDYRRIY